MAALPGQAKHRGAEASFPLNEVPLSKSDSNARWSVTRTVTLSGSINKKQSFFFWLVPRQTNGAPDGLLVIVANCVALVRFVLYFYLVVASLG